MKWGKTKRQSFSPPSRSFFISQVLPTSWITKFKQMNISSGQKHGKMKQKGKCTSVPLKSSQCASNRGKFYGGESDDFWRLSFGEGSVDNLKSRAGLQSVRYNSDDDLEYPPSRTRVNSKEDVHKLNNMASNARKSKALSREVENLPQVQTRVRERVAEIRTPRLRVEKDKNLRKANRPVFEEKQFEFDRIVEREDCKLTASSPLNSRDSCLRKFKKDSVFKVENEMDSFSEENFLSEWQRLKEKKFKELKLRNEEQRKSLYISRELQRKRSKQNSKVRIYSPRTASRAELCKIKALEDMKKAKLKMKKKAKEKTIVGFQGLESFAVVKCSYDPQKDFRDSMMEMIEEKKISRPEELEELLACYLTLNSDEYHDIIIKVFRQVWLELNQACFKTELENEEH